MEIEQILDGLVDGSGAWKTGAAEILEVAKAAKAGEIDLEKAIVGLKRVISHDGVAPGGGPSGWGGFHEFDAAMQGLGMIAPRELVRVMLAGGLGHLPEMAWKGTAEALLLVPEIRENREFSRWLEAYGTAAR